MNHAYRVSNYHLPDDPGFRLDPRHHVAHRADRSRNMARILAFNWYEKTSPSTGFEHPAVPGISLRGAKPRVGELLPPMRRKAFSFGNEAANS
jgi:hypothetical protein